jgi:hypothetical protein
MAPTKRATAETKAAPKRAASTKAKPARAGASAAKSSPKAPAKAAKPRRRAGTHAAKSSPKAPATSAAKSRHQGDLVITALEKLIDSIELDEFGEARAAVARTLAIKLDQAVVSADSLAVPGTAKELREIIDVFQEAGDDAQEFVGGLFAPVGDSAQS